MLSKFFKIFFFVSLAMAIAIAVLATLDATSYWFANMLADMAYSQGEISTAVVALFPIAATILCGVLALIISIPVYFACKKKTAASPKKTKFFLYYFISLIAVSLLVLLFCSLRFDISDRYVWTSDVFIILLLYGACIVEALVLAAFLVSFFTLWKTNRLVACIIGIIILLIIPANYISGYAVYEVSSYSSRYENYGYPDNYPALTEDNGEVVMFEDYPDGVDNDYLSFLLNNNEPSVSSALSVLFGYDISNWEADYSSSLISDIGWTLYKLREHETDEVTNNIPNESEKRISLNKIFDYLVGHPSEAVEALASYRNAVTYYMPVEKFYGTAGYQLLNYLSAAHEDLYKDDDLTRVRNIFKLMNNVEHDWAYEYYDDIKLHINDSYQSRFYDKDGDFDQGPMVWAYSFWARRNAEGTDDVAYALLTMLQDYYSDAEYYQSYDEETGDDYSDEEGYDD